MEFCPTCGNFLQYELPHMGRPARFFCPTCPYVCQIEAKVKIKKKQRLVKKEASLVIPEKDTENMPKIDVPCPNCSHGKAAFQQHQIRKADEGPTTFYKCLNEKCGHQWSGD
ncbi:Zinc finger, TFIIS-type [Dillenia turbinata]|uniref:DNA-directed RNA polymerase subunit n=1 Tax=Dillenia turbinata TaxID=194707 RepID=A0AAN8UJV5_9MAGN